MSFLVFVFVSVIWDTCSLFGQVRELFWWRLSVLFFLRNFELCSPFQVGLGYLGIVVQLVWWFVALPVICRRRRIVLLEVVQKLLVSCLSSLWICCCVVFGIFLFLCHYRALWKFSRPIRLMLSVLPTVGCTGMPFHLWFGLSVGLLLVLFVDPQCGCIVVEVCFSVWCGFSGVVGCSCNLGIWMSV